jgi:hypothetical protein
LHRAAIISKLKSRLQVRGHTHTGHASHLPHSPADVAPGGLMRPVGHIKHADKSVTWLSWATPSLWEAELATGPGL